MHLKVLACEIAAREIYYCASRSANTLSIELLSQGLHDNSDVMRETLQKAIDGVDASDFDGLLLGYGLCNNGIAGLRSRELELVVPRAHDCITFFLGSRERYAEEFDEHPGTYYYTSGWIEYPERRGEKPEYSQKSGLGSTYKQMRQYEELVEKYGEENAQYLMDVMGQWQEEYTHGALIDFGFVSHLSFDERVRAICGERGWDYLQLQGKLDLLQDWLDGRWDEERFLRVPPGHEVQPDYRGAIIKAVAPAESEDADG